MGFPSAPQYLGKPLPRREDLRHLTGKARFVSDLVGPSTCHAAFVRSVVSHGELRHVDVGSAASLPGVLAVFTAADLNLPDIQGRGQPMGRPPLARDRVRYVGEPLAAVVAETGEQAIDAAEQVWPEIEPLPAVVDPRAAATSFPLFPGGNVVSTSPEVPVEIPGGFGVSVDIEVENQRLAPCPIEGLAILCDPTEGGLTVTCGHQAPHRLRAQLASLLGLGEVRVVVPDVGGAFGLKGMFFPEYLVVAAAALRLQRPVAWIERRREHFLGGTHGRSQVHRVQMAGEASGRIRRAHIEILADVGAYPHNGAQIPEFTRLVAGGLYDIEEVTVSSTVVVTNRAPTGSYRGAGRPEAAFAIERAVDAFARAAGLDPAVVRTRNLIRRAQLPYRTATGALYDSGDYSAALTKALELAGATEVRKAQRERLDRGQDPIGLGIGAFIERAGGAIDSGEFAEVELKDSGKVSVRTGSTSSGQGHETVWAQTLAEVFALPPDDVEVVSGDTAMVARGVGTFASRSAQIGASAAWRTGIRVRELARELAAEMLEASPDDLILADGSFSVSGVPGISIRLAEVASRALASGRILRSEEMYVPGAQTFPYGVHVAVVEVELETGQVTVHRLVAVDDCGTVLNPMIVEGQMHGSLAQGWGQALSEAIVYTEDGQPATVSFLDYKIPAATDLPRLQTHRLVSPAPSNPLGAKGTGEAGCIGAPPAIVNAVLDALAPYGVTHVDMPLQPGRVWEAITTAREGHTGATELAGRP